MYKPKNNSNLHFCRQHIAILYSVECPHCTDPILTKEPILRHLTNWLASVTAEWRDIGRSLNVDNTYLESFYRDRGLSDADRLANTLDVWERTDCSPHTFKQLISSLKDKRYKKAVKTVKKNLQDEEIRREYLP